MSGSQQDQLCHSNADHYDLHFLDLREQRCSSDNNYCNSNNKKFGSLWYSQMLDSFLDECEENYGLRNVRRHPGYQMSQSHQKMKDLHFHEGEGGFNNVNYDSESSLSSSFPDESFQIIANKIKRHHESFRKVAKLLRNLQGELKERKDFLGIIRSGRDDGRSCLILNDDDDDAKQGAFAAKLNASTNQVKTQWIFANKRVAVTDMIAKSEGSNANHLPPEKNIITSRSTTKTRPPCSSTIIPSVSPKGNKAEDEIPTTRESSGDPTKSEMTRESVKNSSNISSSRCISPTVYCTTCTLSVHQTNNNDVTLTREVSSYSDSSTSSSKVPVRNEKAGCCRREHKMSSGLLQDLLGKPHHPSNNNLNVEEDDNHHPPKFESRVEVDEDEDNNESELEEEDLDFFTKLFIYFLGFSVVALKALLATFDLDEEDRVVLCEKVKEAQLQVGTLYGEQYVLGLGGQAELLMLTSNDLGFI